MTDTRKGVLDDAERRALHIFERWNRVTGAVTEHTSWYFELQSVIRDAVHCGAQAAAGVRERLNGECEECFDE
jgi:hypothetical protein